MTISQLNICDKETLYNLMSSSSLFRINIISSLSYLHKAKKVLDVGCGYGFLETNLNKEIVGVDIALKSVGYAKKIANKSEFLATDGTTLPFKNDVFDIVIALEMLEHIENHYDLIKEFNRVLKLGGLLILSTPNSFSLFAIFDSLRKKKVFRKLLGLTICSDFEHKRLLTQREVKTILPICGFNLIETKGLETFGILLNLLKTLFLRLKPKFQAILSIEKHFEPLRKIDYIVSNKFFVFASDCLYVAIKTSNFYLEKVDSLVNFQAVVDKKDKISKVTEINARAKGLFNGEHS